MGSQFFKQGREVRVEQKRRGKAVNPAVMKALLAGNRLAGPKGNDPEALVLPILAKGSQLKPQMEIMGAESQRLVGFLFQPRRKTNHPEAVALQGRDDLVDDRIVELLSLKDNLVSIN